VFIELTFRKSVLNLHKVKVYGYNGMEKDKELKGDGNSYTTEFRQYDPRLGRWLSLDPLMAQFPWMSPYVGMDNNPVLLNDPLGLSTEDWVKGQDGIIRWDSGANAGNVEERWGKGSSIAEVGTHVTVPNLGEKDAIILADGKFQTKNGTIHQAGDFANDGTSRELSFKEPQISQDDYGQTNIDAEFSSNKAVEYAPMEVALQGQISDQVERSLRDFKFDQHLKEFNKQMDYLVIGTFAAPVVAIGGAYAAITAPVWAPFAYQTTIQGARFYHNYFGMRGGYVNMAWNAGGQLTQAVADPQGYKVDFLSIGMSGFIRTPTAFSGGTSVLTQGVIGVGSSFLQVRTDGINTPFNTVSTATAINNTVGTSYSNSIYGNNGAALIINNGLIQPVINHFENINEKKK
jgi:RHS repeat-associated protein